MQPARNLAYPDSELVIGMVYAVGTDFFGIQDILEKHLKKFGYTPRPIRLSNFLPVLIETLHLDVKLSDRSEYERINTRMDAGDKARAKAKRGDLLALAAVAAVAKRRGILSPRGIPEAQPRTAHLLLSLKRPEEVFTLRRIYGPGFFLIGIAASEQDRLAYLIKDMDIKDEEDARRLIGRDQEEKEDEEPYGQRTRDTFQLADVFVRTKDTQHKQQLWRFLDLVFGDPYQTPTVDENAMFLAYSASLRSADLSRQVGAAIVSCDGEVIGIGCNDVPRMGGGLYWAGDGDQRDHIRGNDSNHTCRDEIISDIIQRLQPKVAEADRLTEGKRLLQGSPIMDITEFGRAVHAEMEALLACVRTGVSPRAGTLYTTTFPCHNCTRHIVAAGIRRVVYIEPYPKSRAVQLHSDSIKIEGEGEPSVTQDTSDNRVVFEPFVGLGPRRYFDLFSMKMSTGYRITRKDKDGRSVDWTRKQAGVRVPMLPTSYLQREQLGVNEFALATVAAQGGKEDGDERE